MRLDCGLDVVEGSPIPNHGCGLGDPCEAGCGTSVVPGQQPDGTKLVLETVLISIPLWVVHTPARCQALRAKTMTWPR